jgi:hypothetical protein
VKRLNAGRTRAAIPMPAPRAGEVVKAPRHELSKQSFRPAPKTCAPDFLIRSDAAAPIAQILGVEARDQEDLKGLGANRID